MNNRKYVITDLRGNFIVSNKNSWTVSNKQTLAIRFSYLEAHMFYSSNLSIYEKKCFQVLSNEEVEEKTIEEELRVIEERIDQINRLKNKHTSKLSNSDGKICDIMHYIEFNKLDKDESYKMCDMLHKIRLERRKSKDIIAKLEFLQNIHGNKKVVQRIKSARVSIQKMEERKYNPRQLPGLFKKNK